MSLTEWGNRVHFSPRRLSCVVFVIDDAVVVFCSTCLSYFLVLTTFGHVGRRKKLKCNEGILGVRCFLSNVFSTSEKKLSVSDSCNTPDILPSAIFYR